MERRLFLHGIGLVGLSAGLVSALPRHAVAGDMDPLSGAGAGSIYYTADNPGRWAGKEGGHAPIMEVYDDKLIVATAHPMDGYVHYIIKHTLYDADLNFIDEVMFNPENDIPESEFDLSALSGRVYAVSLCNKHDAWLSAIDL